MFFASIWLVIIGVLLTTHKVLTAFYEEGVLSKVVLELVSEKLIYSLLGIGLVVSTLLYVVLQYLLKQMTAPIQELTAEAKQFSKNNLPHNLRKYEWEEMNGLAAAFDKMRERFYRNVRKLEYEKSKAESVLSHLEEGILILDEEGYIREYNGCAKKFLEVETFNKCHISNILRDPICQGMLGQALEKKQTASCEVAKKERMLYIRIGLIGEGDSPYGYIVTLTDVTKTRQLEAIRYQFVTNVTHELKTPLTSIQGFVETLQNGAIENKEVATRFLDIIDIEAKRLYRLIQDILLLSEIENMEEVCSEEVALREVVDEVITLIKGQADAKKIALEVEIDETILLSQVSHDHVKQVVLNLIGNAVRYTDEGKVHIYLGSEDGKKIFTVTDTGIGIQESHMSHIFERFYRADKSRSRKSGGTGLGLSIVKHIVQFYHWEIDVQSEINKGSTFKISF